MRLDRPPSPLREAPRPASAPSPWDRLWWAPGAALSGVFGLWSLTFGEQPGRGVGFLVGGLLLWVVFDR